MFRPISVASPWGVLTQTQVQQGICSRCTCRRGTVLEVTLGESSPGNHTARCKGADPYNRTRIMHIPLSAYPWWHLTTPVHTEQILHCLSTGLVFLLCLLHLKHFWFLEVRERTELANGSEGDESSCGPESKARRAAGLGREVNPLLGIQGLACGPSFAHLGVCTYSSQMLLWFPCQLRKSYYYSEKKPHTKKTCFLLFPHYCYCVRRSHLTEQTYIIPSITSTSLPQSREV